MTAELHEAEFVATVVRERPLLQRSAHLLLDDPESAPAQLDAVLAGLYDRGVPATALRTEALRALVSDRPVRLPGRTAPRFELVEAPPPPAPGSIDGDLAQLPRPERAVVVLHHLVRLPDTEIAQVLDLSPDEVVGLRQQGEAALALARPGRSVESQLAAELRAAVPAELGQAHGGFEDLVRGRLLIRRRWLRRGLSVAAALVLVVVLASQLAPRPGFVPDSAPPITNLPTATPTPKPPPACDTSQPVCRTTILQGWRAEMARVAGEYVDPDRDYFTGYSFSYDSRYESPEIWSGQGRLGLDLFRLQSGSTQIYLQLATSRREATRCGSATQQTCHSQSFMDGNRFTLSESADLAHGLEVQYSPYGDQVITVVARNTTKGRELPVTRAQLLELVQDPRLRLPNL